MHRFQTHLEWRNWTFGILFPHGGMVVWCLFIGPFWIEYWPRAQKIEERPF